MQEQRKTAKATTSEMILEALREQIINGTLVPQEKLVEAEKAKLAKAQEKMDKIVQSMAALQ